MQKFIRIVAIIAAVFVGLSFLLLLVSIPFQQILATRLFGYPADMAYYLPIFPVGQFIQCLLLLVCTILLAICAGKKGVILPEILSLIGMICIAPIFGDFLLTMLTTYLSYTKGDIYVAANAIATSIGTYCMWPANLGNSLALVVCGMSIVFKRMSKKLASNTNA